MNTYATYRMPLLLAATFAVIWGLLSMVDLPNISFSGLNIGPNNMIAQITPGSPAEQAGFQAGDQIQSIDGVAMQDAATRARRLRPAIEETRTYVVTRAGASLSLDLTYASLPATPLTLGYAGIFIGFCFIFFGLLPFLRKPGKAALLLALVGLFLGLAFLPGPYFTAYILRTLSGIMAFLFVTLGFATLLHFMLYFPTPKAFLKRAHAMKLLYGPALLIAAFLLYRGLFQPPATGVVNAITTALIGLMVVGYFGLSAIAVVHSYRKATPEERATLGLNIMLAGILLALLPNIASFLINIFIPQVAIPGFSFIFLTLVFIPLSLALAVLKQEKHQAVTKLVLPTAAAS